MDIIDKVDRYLIEDVRGKVKIGSVTLDTNVDFQRMILNQSEPNTSSKVGGTTYYGGSGLKNPLTEKEIEKIYKQSKEYWKNGGYYHKWGKKKKAFIELNIMIHDPRESKPYYASWSYGGWVGSTKGFNTPQKAIKDGIEDLEFTIRKRQLEE